MGATPSTDAVSDDIKALAFRLWMPSDMMLDVPDDDLVAMSIEFGGRGKRSGVLEMLERRSEMLVKLMNRVDEMKKRIAAGELNTVPYEYGETDKQEE